jgi:methyl-accepting chemotaxis protein
VRAVVKLHDFSKWPINSMFQLFQNLRRCIVGRMLLFVVLPTILVFGLVITLASRAAFRNLRQAAEQQLQLQAKLVAHQIEDLNDGAVISAQRMAEAQVAGMFGDRQTSLEYARAVLEGYDGITGAYFCYEPNADGKDKESLNSLPAESMDPDGRFSPYWFVAEAEGRTIELEPTVNMESSLYYQGVKDAFNKTKKPTFMVTEPYVYQGKMITEQVYPIVIDGEFKGVAGVDFALADIEAQLRRIAEEEGVELFLVSSRGNFIAATTDPEQADSDASADVMRTRNVTEFEAADLFQKLTLQRRNLEPVLDVSPRDGQMYYYAAAHIRTGDWTVVARKSESEILAPIRRQIRTRLVVALCGVSVVLGLLLIMTFRFGRRINTAVEAAERVASGDLGVEISCTNCQEETGVLLRALKIMTENLNALVGNVKQASIQLNSTATELSATSRQQESTASSFGASANQIAAAVKQISATSAELVNTMDDVTQVAVGTTEVATAGRASLQDMEGNMRDLDDATGSIGDKLAVINEKAANITGIVTTITKVADQTNLLSVNAAIEAEKAGEYGVGFLVVAREIRRLADQTAAATLDIEQMVGQMQSAVSAGVMEMDRFTDQVRRNVLDVAQISQQMTEIIERVSANTEKFERVNESMQSQAQGADQISQAMGQLTTHASQTSEAIHEYARAANDLQDAIDSLKSAIASFQLKS